MTKIAAQWVGSGTPNSLPTAAISATSTMLTMMQCASSPRKYVHAGSGVARARLRMPFWRRIDSTIASWL